MMMKNVLFAVALLSVALWTGCATGGGGHTGGNIQVTVSTTPANQNVVGVTLTVQFTATVTNTDNKAVTWSLTQSGGTACTAACGTINSSGLYTAPSTPPNPAVVNVVATSVASPDKSDSYQMKVLPITVIVTPGPAIVETNRKQQFTATVTPDTAPQTVAWAITDCPSGPCGSVDANGLYTAPNSIPTSVSVQATSTIDSPNWAGKSKITIVNSRLSGPYAFRVSGFDSTNHPIAAVGNFIANDDGTIQGGTSEDMLVAGVPAHCTILNTSTYVLDGNNHGTISLRTSGSGGCTSPALRKYQVVLNASGSGQIIEFDSSGRSSGVLAQVGSASALAGTFVFGFTGSDLAGKRVGLAGVFQADGAGGIASTGSLDINDNGAATSTSSFDPVLSGYSISGGSGSLTLVSNGTSYNFAIYVVGGKTQNAVNPLTLFAISNDGPTNHAALGTIVFQDPAPTYDKSALDDFSVSNLTGVDSSGSNTLVSLTVARGDGNGNFAGSYDANNAGTIIAAKSFNSTYSASGNGRYTLDLLSPGRHFVLYLSAANRGLLLDVDQSSNAVYTGTMDQQSGGGSFANSAMAGSFDGATVSSGTSGVSQVAMNLLLTSSAPDFTVSGQQDETDNGQNPISVPLTGTYSVTFDGTGKITLTQPAKSYVVYLLDTSKQGQVQHFLMMDADSANPDPSIIFAER